MDELKNKKLYYEFIFYFALKNKSKDTLANIPIPYIPDIYFQLLKLARISNYNLTTITQVLINKEKIMLNNYLISACIRNNIDVVKYVIENGADIHINDECPFRTAVFCKYIDIAKYLLSKGANVHISNDFCIISTIYNNCIEMTKLLLDYGANIHIDNDILLRNSCHCGNFDMVKFLIKNGANIYSNNNAALMQAITQKHYSIAKYLIENGAKINTKSILENYNLSKIYLKKRQAI